jgi:hypothetical protein
MSQDPRIDENAPELLRASPSLQADENKDGIDEELTALRTMDQELSHQLEQAERQLSDQQAFRLSLQQRIQELHGEADDFTSRHESLCSSLGAMRREMKEWNDASAVYYDWLVVKNHLDDAEEKVKTLQDRIRDAPANVINDRHRTHDALAQIKRFLNQYIVSAVCTQLGNFGASEQRFTSSSMQDAVIPELTELAGRRERFLHEVCNDADYRAEESIRLESSHKTIAEQCLTEAVDLEATKNDQLQKIEDAFQGERSTLLRIKARLEAEAKEIEFHMKRGTLAKGSTKMTSADVRLHEKFTAQQDELKQQLQSFEALRNEKLQLEREAESSLHRLIKSREDQNRQKSSARARLDELRHFRELLGEERADWLRMKREMQDVIVSQQAKIRAATVDAAA